MREYRSFEEVDRDLKILKLQNEIDKEELKLSIKRVKKEASPKELFKNLSAAVKEKALETKAMVEGAAKGFIEDFNEKNFNRSGAKIRVEPVKPVETVETEVIVEKVVIDTGTTTLDRDRERPNL